MSLTIYIIGMIIVVGIIATFTSFFYKNVNIDDITVDTTQFTKFSSAFLKDINKSGNYVVDYKALGDDNVSYVVFATGNQYTFMKESNSIYKNKVKLCSDVEFCNFDVSFVDSKFVVGVEFKTKNVDFSEDNSLKYSMNF